MMRAMVRTGHEHDDALTATCCAAGTVATTYRVAELDCATEERELRDVLGLIDGVRDLTFDLVGRQVTIGHTLADPAPLAAAIRDAGMRPDEVVTPIDEPART